MSDVRRNKDEVPSWRLPDEHPLNLGARGREGMDVGRPGRRDAAQVTPKPDHRVSGEKSYCFHCGTPWDESELSCTACGSKDRELGAAKPTVEAPGDGICFSGPWKMIPWPGQGAVSITGGPGAGKSSLAGILRPTFWLTKEQEPKHVGKMFQRLLPDGHMPMVVSIDTPEKAEQILRTVRRGPVVFDSLTALGLREALITAHIMTRWARDNNDRSLSILQFNKDGQAAGYNEIPHLFDCNIEAEADPWGVRVFNIRKSRWCPLDSMYWRFNENGQLDIPKFPAAYSIEGKPGSYSLHPYPVPGAKWSGLLAALSEAGILRPQMAACATSATYMPTGFLEPMDVHERRRFAERHDLTWITPEMARVMLNEQPEVEL